MAIDWAKLDNIYNSSPLTSKLWNLGKNLVGYQEPVDEAQKLLGDVYKSAYGSILSDREHQEMREDTAYQRAVADMQKAGLNPYTIGSNSSTSSSSSVGLDVLSTKLQMVGYLLDLKNLDVKNKQLANQQLNTILNGLKLLK